MLGLDYLMAGYIHLAAAEQFKCQAVEPPMINVVATSNDLVIDESKSILELTSMMPDIRTRGPYAGRADAFVEGLAMGSVDLVGNYRFLSQTTNTGLGCVHINNIRIEIRIDPKVYIAREYQKGTCHYDAVMEHERKHVAVNRAVTNKYIGLIGEAIKRNLNARGYVFGPVQAGQIPQAQNDLSRFLDAIIQPYATKYIAEREARQAKVDTLEEYQRVAKKCPGHQNPLSRQ